MIEPRTLRGFRDFLPESMARKELMLDRARHVYRQYGFLPIDTPALEYTEILLGKGGAESDKQLYRFTDAGGRDVALRFDLTVPFARFAAQHVAKLGTPLKRYHMGPVWRGENTQHGRYREFWQCDFDTIGTTGNASDVEVVLVIHDLLAALGLERFRIHVNNRMVLNGLLEELGLADRTRPILVALDKLGKAGSEAVAAEMAQTGGVGREQAERLLALTRTQGTNTEILERLRGDFGANARAREGISRLAELLDVVAGAGVAAERVRLDLSIARGLDYYTGTVYETFLEDMPGIGSVCSGGRYDNLAGLYTRQPLPGVGASLGLDRLLAAMEELKVGPESPAAAPVLIVQFTADRLADYERLARQLRAAGLGVEVYPDTKKIGQQLQYAERRGFRVAVLAGPEEFAQGAWKVKDLARRQESAVPAPQVTQAIRQILAGPSA